MHPHGSYVRGAKRSRIDRHWGGVERLETRTDAVLREVEDGVELADEDVAKDPERATRCRDVDACRC